MKPDLTTKLFDGIQSFCAASGKWSCYAFCVLKIAERFTGHTYDPLTEIVCAIEKGFVKYNWDNPEDPDNLYVEAPAAWLQNLTGCRWQVEKTPTIPTGRWIVEVWNNAHFRLPDWDSLIDSKSVATGQITSWRAFTQI